ncbi:unnamed protein product [Hyaloperonospora brassicae]|uniref:WRKY transcription factor 19 n=1 Tax=Hyaloperonospora brassicae TaxID=162125 RepID=A0AAV0UMB3_HYABA|nr:unnamed protein product [Hyaloperonospora brassicae]
MDEVAFVESLFSPEMRSNSVAVPSSVFSSPSSSLPSSSRGRVHARTGTGSCTGNFNSSALVPAPPNSLLGGGIAFSQLHAPFQPLTADDAPLFVRLHDDDVLNQMLNDQDFPDFASGLKCEHDGGGKLFSSSPTTSLLLEPLELPRLHGDVHVKDGGFCTDAVSYHQSSYRPRRSGIVPTTAGSSATTLGHGYTLDATRGQLLASVPMNVSVPIGFDATSGTSAFVSYAPVAAHPWIQEDVSTPLGAHCQRLHSDEAHDARDDRRRRYPPIKSRLCRQAAQYATSTTSSTTVAAAPGLWTSTTRSASTVAGSGHRASPMLEPSRKTLHVRSSPLSVTISPPSSLTSKALKELIVSTDFGLPLPLLASRQKRARLSKKDRSSSSSTKGAAKAARTAATASPARSSHTAVHSSSCVAATTKGKKCIEADCTRRAQSNSRCKAHGGGARCQYAGPGGCARSSQGGGFCRAHGGGKRCEFPGCTRGQQRKGRCYVHGGIRKCQYGTCEKKDRGNGFCISHGGGKRCQHPNCSRAVRRGLLCQIHETQSSGASMEGEQRDSVLV